VFWLFYGRIHSIITTIIIIGMNAHLVSDYCDVSISVLSVGLIKCLAWYVHNDKVIAPELDKTDMVQETAACQVWTFFSSAL